MTGDTFETCDVAVVGLGPVGMALANLLGQLGHRVIGIDAATGILDMPRAIGLDHEALRLLQQIGVAERLLPFTGVYRPSEYRAADGGLLRRVVTVPEPYPLAWTPNVTFLQPELERLLRQRARDWPSLAIRLGHELTAIGDVDAVPMLTTRDIASGAVARIQARYVIACDGAASFVRKALAIGSESLDFDEPWLVVDMLLTGEGEPPALPEAITQYCDPARPHTYVLGPGALRRWEFMLLPGEDAGEMVQADNVWRLLAPWLSPRQARIWRAATYRFHALVAETWRRGHVLLAGDAAHQTPPFLGQGLNQGLRDVSNLAWKLSAVLAGAPSRLLDSYQVERRPNVRSVIATTKAAGAVICERDPVRAAERDRRMKAEVAAGTGTLIRQDMLPPVVDGLIGRDRLGRPLPGAGHTCPQPWITTSTGRRRLDDVLGPGFLILLSSSFEIGIDPAGVASDWAAVERLAAALPARITRVTSVNDSGRGGRGAPEMRIEALIEIDDVLAAWLQRWSATAVIARPDHIAFGCAVDPARLAGLLRDLTCALTSGEPEW